MADDRNRPITLADLDRFATKDDLKIFATKDDLKTFATKVDLALIRDELRDFRSEFTTFKDRTENTLDWVVTSIGDLKQEMTVMRDSRMRRIHDRLTRVEKKAGLPPEEYY